MPAPSTDPAAPRSQASFTSPNLSVPRHASRSHRRPGRRALLAPATRGTTAARLRASAPSPSGATGPRPLPPPCHQASPPPHTAPRDLALPQAVPLPHTGRQGPARSLVPQPGPWAALGRGEAAALPCPALPQAPAAEGRGGGGEGGGPSAPRGSRGEGGRIINSIVVRQAGLPAPRASSPR